MLFSKQTSCALIKLNNKVISHPSHPTPFCLLLSNWGKNDAMAKIRRTQQVGSWRKSDVNHLYWSASTSASGEEVVASWCSVANHIQDVHTHENPLFPRCLHQPLVDEQARQWPSKCSSTLTNIQYNNGIKSPLTRVLVVNMSTIWFGN